MLPGNRRIERAEKMGVVSNGMLCSGDELRLTSDADGILILPSDTPLGAPLVDLFGDVVLDVDVKPNRGDALSILGLAREVAAATGQQVRMPEITVHEGSGPSTADRLAVEIRDPDLCTGFAGRWVSGVTIGPSPDAVQMRLLAAGQRPISNVVDVSNYVMLELGKPIHTFDAAAVRPGADGRATIVVRRATPGERLETLDHVERELAADMLLIADPAGRPRRRRRDGRRQLRGVRPDPRRRHRVGHLRPRQHPAHRPASRPPLRGVEPLREGPGAAHGPPGRGPHGAAHPSLGRGRDRPGRGGHRSGPARADTRRVPPGAREPPAGHGALGCGAAELLARVGVETEPAPAGAPVTIALKPEPLVVGGRARTPSRRSCPPGAATSPSRPMWRRRSRGFVATS